MIKYFLGKYLAGMGHIVPIGTPRIFQKAINEKYISAGHNMKLRSQDHRKKTSLEGGQVENTALRSYIFSILMLIEVQKLENLLYK